MFWAAASSVQSKFAGMVDGDGCGYTILPDPVKSPQDDKEYMSILMDHGLKVLLVSDTKAMAAAGGVCYDDDDDDYDDDDDCGDDDGDDSNDDNNDGSDDDDDSKSKGGQDDGGPRNAACAMAVGVGSYYDPPSFQGLSHILEHMLFLGTEEYPVENEYSDFISTCGGSDNAFTEMENTVYHFEVPQQKVFQALKMFSSFFKCPLLDSESVSRELQAVESEFRLSLNSDMCRLQQLFCHTSKPLSQHPFSTFSWGNAEYLSPGGLDGIPALTEALKSHYKHHYHAENMTLVLMAAYPLKRLLDECIKMFSGLPRAPPSSPDAPPPAPLSSYGMPFARSNLCKVYRIVPVKERHDLFLTFQLPEQVSVSAARFGGACASAVTMKVTMKVLHRAVPLFLAMFSPLPPPTHTHTSPAIHSLTFARSSVLELALETLRLSESPVGSRGLG